MATLYPIKQLKDTKKQPFFPFITTDAVLVNGSSETAATLFANRYTKAETNALIAALGTVLSFKGVVPTRDQLPTTGMQPGWVYIILHYPTAQDTITHSVVWDGTKWEDMGEPIDLSMFYTKGETDTLVSNAILNSELTQRDITNLDIDNAIILANQYTNDEILALDIGNYYNKAETDSRIQELSAIKAVSGNFVIADEVAIGENVAVYTKTVTNIRMSEGSPAHNTGKNFIVFITRTSTNQAVITYQYEYYTNRRVDFIGINSPTVTNQNILSLALNQTVTGVHTFTNGILVNKTPVAPKDVVTLDYLNSQVVGPLQDLINRLLGE